MALTVDYETDTGRVQLDISASATLQFGVIFQDRVITPKGVASIIGVQAQSFNNQSPKLFVLYDGSPFVTAVTDATTAEIKQWKKLSDSTSAGTVQMQDTREFHHLREVNCFGQRRTVVMQSQNGPCPIIAIANTLLLRGQLPSIERLSVGRHDAVATAQQLRDAVLEVIRERRYPPPEFSETAREDGTLSHFVKSSGFERLRETLRGSGGPQAMQRFYDGLFVEPIHDVIDGFSGADDAAMFALAGVKLVHGWIMDFTAEGTNEDTSAMRKMSCSEMQVAATMVDTAEGRIAERFLNTTPTQVTELGIAILSSEMNQHEAVVMFRNNHFGACMMHQGKLYSLVTDVIFTQRSDVVWQEVKVKDDGDFVDGACGELEPCVIAALEKFSNRYSVEQIRGAIQALMQQPNDLFLMAIQDQIDKKSAKPAAAAAAAASVGTNPDGAVPVSSQPHILTGTVVSSN